MIIAVDGEAASGKGTLSKRLAAHLGLGYLDTGKLYRATAAAALAAGADMADEPAVAALAAALPLQALTASGLDDEHVGTAASQVAALPGVRAALLAYQQDFAARPGGAVLDGRDIGTVVCPAADVKFYVTASLEVRAERRTAQLRAAGRADVSAQSVAADLAARDARDAGRASAPLRRATDAHLLDTTGLSIDAAFVAALTHVEAVMGMPHMPQGRPGGT